ncbi:VOC family protein [Nocardia alni]|uniref:VOC family protein n=1 Tax=Nocardia alni TaxID=2815723 RepID=UPI001C243DFC|nr:VOC family protein [Nocardia alni]
MATGFAPGAPCWFDMAAIDIPAAAEFYRGVFGWTAQDTGPQTGHYTVLSQDDALVAAIGSATPDDSATPDGEPLPSRWLPYFAVDDVRRTVTAASADGGAARCAYAEIPGQLEFAILTDPDGADYGLAHLTGHPGTQRWGWPNNPCWVQYTATRTPAEAMAHYAKALGWDYRNAGWETSTENPYQALAVGEREFGGAAAARPGEPAPFWALTVHVPDCDTAATRAAELGGTITQEPHDNPGPSRLAVIADPAGATLALMAFGG